MGFQARDALETQAAELRNLLGKTRARLTDTERALEESKLEGATLHRQSDNLTRHQAGKTRVPPFLSFYFIYVAFVGAPKRPDESADLVCINSHMFVPPAPPAPFPIVQRLRRCSRRRSASATRCGPR